jgi:hypothetical protein
MYPRILYYFVLLSLSVGLMPIARATVIHIPDDYPTIQQGVDAAMNGDTVLVHPGTYTENVQASGKTLTLASLFLTTGDESYISNTIINNGAEEFLAAVNLLSGTYRIIGLKITGVGFSGEAGLGIHCTGFVEISNNLIVNNHNTYGFGSIGAGIYCSGTIDIINNTISGNYFYSESAINKGAGIYCSGTINITGNTISNNGVLSMSGYGTSCQGAGIYASGICTITNNTITNNYGDSDDGNYGFTPQLLGAGIYCSGEIAISDNEISDNNYTLQWPDGTLCGGGIYVASSTSCTIERNTISGNSLTKYASYGDQYGSCCGGGIYLTNTANVFENQITSNHVTSSIYGCGSTAHSDGGGIYCYSAAEIRNNIISNNTTSSSVSCIDGAAISRSYGGGVYGGTCFNNVIAGNHASASSSGTYSDSQSRGGGIYEGTQHTNNTIVNNQANCNLIVEGGGIYGGNIINSIIVNNSPDNVTGSSVSYSDVEGGFYGTGNIDADPLFVSGPEGNYYLSQIAAGQDQQSPCVDAGNPASPLLTRSTRTDGVMDAGIIDMGYRYPSILYPPNNLQAMLEGFDIFLIWEMPEFGAPDGYNVYCNDVKLNEDLITVTEYADYQNVPGQYIYWVTAVFIEEESGPSNTAVVEIVLFPPENLTAFVEGNNVALNWDSLAYAEVMGYNLYCNETLVNDSVLTANSYYHTCLPTGTYEYWVTGVYISGESGPSESAMVDILVSTDERYENQTGIYPNPTSDFVRLDFQYAKKREIRIYDVFGNLKQYLFFEESSCRVNLSMLHSGIYLLEVTSKENQKICKKLLKH